MLLFKNKSNQNKQYVNGLLNHNYFVLLKKHRILMKKELNLLIMI